MILCADCGADLTMGTGSLTHETSACPFCGHQVFEKYGDAERRTERLSTLRHNTQP